MRTCIYCNTLKPYNEFSQEHILPKAIGGILLPTNPLTTHDVCKRCNNISGFFIDAPFAKSWFINNYRAGNAIKVIRPSDSAIFPLTYFGVLEEYEFEGQVCEYYMGPAGDPIYHFHKPYPEELGDPTIIGIPPHLRNRGFDNGFSFLFIKADNPEWHRSIIFSFYENFKKSIRYAGNFDVGDGGSIFSQIPDRLNDLRDKLIENSTKTHSASAKIDIDMGNRFLAKLSLGMGCKFLHDGYKTSNDADSLRKFMWARSKEERDLIPLHGTGLLNSSLDELDKLLKYDGAHILNLITIGDSVALYSNFYGQRGALMQISNDKSHRRDMISDSIMFIIFPELQRYVGPTQMIKYINHKTGTRKLDALVEIEEHLRNLPPQPVTMLN